MKPPARESETRETIPFGYPLFHTLYVSTVRDVADRRVDPAMRQVAARVLAFLVREQTFTERVATDVLTALHKSLDVPMVVRTLLVGLRDVAGDTPKIVEWTRNTVDRSIKEGQLPSFVTAMRILVDLRDFDGTVPTRWRLALLRGLELPGLPPRLFMFSRDYARRFPQDSWWLRTVRVRSTIASLRRRATASDSQEADES